MERERALADYISELQYEQAAKSPRYEVIYLRQIELENIQSSRDKFLPLPDIFCCDGDKSVSA